jgi:hypothetical protein
MGFIRNTNIIPLLLDEFLNAALYYPIIFINGPPLIPVAVVGLEPDRNLFVNEEGDWPGDVYPPLYLRFYPFGLQVGLEDKKTILCIDAASDYLNEQEGDPLFEDGHRTKFNKQIHNKLDELIQDELKTIEFSSALIEQELIVGINLSIPFSHKTLLFDALIIRGEQLEKLPSDVVVEWHRRGWFPAIYAQLSFMNHFNKMIQLYARIHDVQIVSPTAHEQDSSEPKPIETAPPAPTFPSLDELKPETSKGFRFRLKRRPGRGKAF